MPGFAKCVVGCLYESDDGASEVRDVNHVMGVVSAYQDLCRFALGQSTECWRSKDRSFNARAKKIRCSNCRSFNPSVGKRLLPQTGRAASGRRFAAIVDWRQSFVKRLVLRAVEIQVVGVDHSRANLFTSCQNGCHRPWPAFLPDFARIGQAECENDCRCTRDRAGELLGIHGVSFDKAYPIRELSRFVSLDHTDLVSSCEQEARYFASYCPISNHRDLLRKWLFYGHQSCLDPLDKGASPTSLVITDSFAKVRNVVVSGHAAIGPKRSIPALSPSARTPPRRSRPAGIVADVVIRDGRAHRGAGALVFGIAAQEHQQLVR